MGIPHSVVKLKSDRKSSSHVSIKKNSQVGTQISTSDSNLFNNEQGAQVGAQYGPEITFNNGCILVPNSGICTKNQCGLNGESYNWCWAINGKSKWDYCNCVQLGREKRSPGEFINVDTQVRTQEGNKYGKFTNIRSQIETQRAGKYSTFENHISQIEKQIDGGKYSKFFNKGTQVGHQYGYNGYYH